MPPSPRASESAMHGIALARTEEARLRVNEELMQQSRAWYLGAPEAGNGARPTVNFMIGAGLAALAVGVYKVASSRVN